MFYSRVSLASALIITALLLPATASARNVFLNEENINTIRSQTFENVTVTIDGKGNVHIKGDKYLIHSDAPKGAPPKSALGIAGSKALSAAQIAAKSGPATEGTTAKVPPGQLSLQYWLVSEETGSSQYDIDLFLNDKHIKTVKSGEPQVVVDVTRHVILGENKVIVRAVKNLGDKRKSDSKDEFLRIYIGRGQTGDNNAILMDNPVLEFKRTAADMDNTAEQLSFKVP